MYNLPPAPLAAELPTDAAELHNWFVQWLRSIAEWFSANQMNLINFALGVGVSLLLAAIISYCFRFAFRKLFGKRPTGSGALLAAKLPLPIGTGVFVLGLFVSSNHLLHTLSNDTRELCVRGLWAVFSFVVLWGIFRGIAVLDGVLHKIAEADASNINLLLVNLIRKTLKAVIAVIAVLFIFQNILGLNITALLAGAGVAGLAIAFAAQNTVANFISSVMVIMDKPFKVGDRVKINGIDGTVEEVGLRSTRIRALDGDLFALPNSMVADSAIENVSRRPSIKYAFDVTMTYSTTPDQMHRAVALLRSIIATHPECSTAEQPPYVHFGEFRDWSLTINVICWFVCDWDTFLETRQKLNFEILEKFNASGLEFAFPTSTTYLAGVNKEPVIITNKESVK